MSVKLLILPSYNKINGFSNSTVDFSELLIKYGEIYPLLNCIPSTISTKVSPVLLSPAVIIPLNPTDSIASAII